MEVAAALAAFQQVLQQVEHLRVPLGLDAPLLLQLLRPFPGLIVDHLRDRNLNPGVPRLVVDLHAVLRWRHGGTCRRPRCPCRWHSPERNGHRTDATAACQSGWGLSSSVSRTALE